jgi:hypothetical protein
VLGGRGGGKGGRGRKMNREGEVLTSSTSASLHFRINGPGDALRPTSEEYRGIAGGERDRQAKEGTERRRGKYIPLAPPLPFVFVVTAPSDACRPISEEYRGEGTGGGDAGVADGLREGKAERQVHTSGNPASFRFRSNGPSDAFSSH